MSIKYLNLVWEKSRARGSALVVMLALADMANDVGECYPGQSKLAEKCRMAKRALQRTLYQLQDDGEIMILNRRAAANQYLSNIYQITIGGNDSVIVTSRSQSRQGNDSVIVTPRSQSRQGNDSVIDRVTITESSNPFIDPSKEPEGDPKDQPAPLNPILAELKKRKGGQ